MSSDFKEIIINSNRTLVKHLLPGVSDLALQLILWSSIMLRYLVQCIRNFVYIKTLTIHFPCWRYRHRLKEHKMRRNHIGWNLCL
ncbi:hypothetical protein D3C74_275900 [compost metagenome]